MKHRFVRFSSILALFLALVGMQLQCENIPGFLQDRGIGNVGSDGGTVRLLDGNGNAIAQAVFPPGALTSETTITILPLGDVIPPEFADDPQTSCILSQVFQFGPDGITFDELVEIILFISGQDLGDVDPDDLVIITTPLNGQAGLATAAIDFESGGGTTSSSGTGFNVRGTISHFSPFAIASASCLGIGGGEDQPPAPGQDMVVFNDHNVFDNGALATADNVRLVQNLVNFTSAGSRVWVDCSSSQSTLEACNSSSFSTFRSTITGEGLTFEDAGDLTNIPADVRVIFLWQPTTAYTTAEINGLKQFAENGGRIVFVGEHGGFYTAIDTVQNPFLDAMGSDAENQGGQVDCGRTIIPESSIDDPRHQITQGLGSVSMGCSSVMNPIGPSDHVLYRDTGGTENLSIVTVIDTAPIAAVAVPGGLEAAAEREPMSEAEALRASLGE